MSKEQKCRELEKLAIEREKRMASETSSPIGCCSYVENFTRMNSKSKNE